MAHTVELSGYENCTVIGAVSSEMGMSLCAVQVPSLVL